MISAPKVCFVKQSFVKLSPPQKCIINRPVLVQVQSFVSIPTTPHPVRLSPRHKKPQETPPSTTQDFIDSKMLEHEDILSIDRKIRKILLSRISELPILEKRRRQLLWIFDHGNRYEKIQSEKQLFELNKKIEAIKSNNQIQQYEALTRGILERHEQLFNDSNMVQFVKRCPLTARTNTSEYEKTLLRKKYLMIIPGFVKIRNDIKPGKTKVENVELCNICGCCNFYTSEEGKFLCQNCGAHKEKFNLDLTYRDTDRVNLIPRFNYTRRGHMNEAMQKLQGKQNTTIPPAVNNMLYDEMEKNSITPDRLTKSHISLFLCQHGYGDQYENVNLIHHEITGKPCPDISQYEHIILEMNDQIEQLYKTRKGPDRKNSMNIHYKLFKICEAIGLNICREDFSFLKTSLKVKEHDDICAPIFQALGWYFVETRF
jgi:uncharacterized Zn finger protein (UPF0148 family)